MSSTSDSEAQWLSAVLPGILKSGRLIEGSTDIDKFVVRDIRISLISTDEAFMLTNCYRAVVAFEFAGVADTRSLVVKKTPQVPEDVFDSVSFGQLFNNEIETYVKIMPAIEQFADKKLNVPKYLYSDLQRGAATMALYDFAVDGWRMSKTKTNLSLDHVLLAVKYLANWHGICFALRHKDRSRFDDITSGLLEARYANVPLHPEWLLMLNGSIQRTVRVTRQHYPEVAESFLQQLLRVMSDNYGYSKRRVEQVEPMVTLCHGDYLRNNIAFKYATDEEWEESKTAQDVMMFDLQTMRIGSPMVDLTTFLCLSVFAEVRYKHFKTIFKAYSDGLATAYEKHTKEKLPEFLSYDSLLAEYTRFLPYGTGIASYFLMSLVEPEKLTTAERLTQLRTPEEIIEDLMTRGGETVDRELAHQTKEMYDLSQQLGLDLFAGFELENGSN